MHRENMHICKHSFHTLLHCMPSQGSSEILQLYVTKCTITSPVPPTLVHLIFFHAAKSLQSELGRNLGHHWSEIWDIFGLQLNLVLVSNTKTILRGKERHFPNNCRLYKTQSQVFHSGNLKPLIGNFVFTNQ